MLQIGDNGYNMEFISEQLEKAISKIKIIDDSVDMEKIKKSLLHYYSEKFEKWNNGYFEYDFIDLFCGAGGLSIGLEQVGFRPIIAIDKEPSALLTYRFNRPWMTSESIINDDIRNLVDEQIFPHVPVVVGGPPCQGFSVVNKHKKENDERNELYKFYVHAVDQAKPEIFLMENVEGILKLYERIQGDFAEIGYTVCMPLVLSPKEFGFPQSRKRAFILGIKNTHADIVEELYDIFTRTVYNLKNEKILTLWDAIGDLPVIEAKTLKNSTYVECQAWGYTFAGMQKNSSEYAKLVNCDAGEDVPLLNHRSKYNNERDIQIYHLLKPGEKSDAESIQEINPYKSRSDIFRDKFDKLVANEPCKAITAHMYYDCNMYIHPTQARGLSPREAARVQGFPDDYLFLGTPNEWYRQIGNAVSPLMAKSINGGAPKFSVSLIIPKSDTKTVEKIKAAIQAAYEEGQSKLKGNGKSVPALSVIKTPLRDGDTERPDDPAYAGCYFINANSSAAPGIVDADRQPILDRSEVYSGVYGRASISLYAFNSNGNRGIACGLNNLQKIKDGDPLGGKSRAEDDFATETDDDFLN